MLTPSPPRRAADSAAHSAAHSAAASTASPRTPTGASTTTAALRAAAPAAPSRDRTAHDAARAPLPDFGHVPASAVDRAAHTDLVAEHAKVLPAEYVVPEHMWHYLYHSIANTADTSPTVGGPNSRALFCDKREYAKYITVLCVENAVYHGYDDFDDNGCDGGRNDVGYVVGGRNDVGYVVGRRRSSCTHLSVGTFKAINNMYGGATEICVDFTSAYDAQVFFAYLRLFPAVRKLRLGARGRYSPCSFWEPFPLDAATEALAASGVTDLALSESIPVPLLFAKRFDAVELSLGQVPPNAENGSVLRAGKVSFDANSSDATVALCNTITAESGIHTLKFKRMRLALTIVYDSRSDDLPLLCETFDAVLRAVRAAGRLKLSLQWCNLRNEDCAALAEVGSNLRSLNIIGNYITHEGLDALAPLLASLECFKMDYRQSGMLNWERCVGKFKGYNTPFEVALRQTKSLRRLCVSTSFATSDKGRFALGYNTSITELHIEDCMDTAYEKQRVEDIFTLNSTLAHVVWVDNHGENFTCKGLEENAQAVKEKENLRQRAAAMVFCWEQRRAKAMDSPKVTLAHQPEPILSIIADYLVHSWVVPRFRDGYREDYCPITYIASIHKRCRT